MAKSASPQWRALGGGSNAMRRCCSNGGPHPMAKSHPVDETRTHAVERPKRQRRLNAKKRIDRAKVLKRQTRRERPVGTRSRTKPATGKQTRQQTCLDLLSRQEGATIRWAVKKKLGLTLLSDWARCREAAKGSPSASPPFLPRSKHFSVNSPRALPRQTRPYQLVAPPPEPPSEVLGSGCFSSGAASSTRCERSDFPI